MSKTKMIEHIPCPVCEKVGGYCGGSEYPSCGLFVNGQPVARLKIFNLTQHDSTPEQGVIDGWRNAVREELTFDDVPTKGEIEMRAAVLAGYAADYLYDETDPACTQYGAMIGGAPYLMGPLEAALKAAGLRVFYAFSRRESEDQVQADGSVRKVSVFRHAGFIEV